MHGLVVVDAHAPAGVQHRRQLKVAASTQKTQQGSAGRQAEGAPSEHTEAQAIADSPVHAVQVLFGVDQHEVVQRERDHAPLGLILTATTNAP